MDIGLQEWLIIISVIIIGGILIDGWRRMSGNKGRLRIKLDQNLSDLPEVDNAEVGPSRVVAKDAVDVAIEEDDLPSFSARNELRAEPSFSDESLGEALAAERTSAVNDQAPSTKKSAATQDEPVEVLVISVLSRDGGFKGPQLLQNILESGLRYGDMDIFHRHESMSGHGDIQFSLANAVKPGTFDLDDIDHFSTPAVSFFMQVPGPQQPKHAFDLMLEAARRLANDLNGDLKDDQRSVLTAQTIEHYRQRIVDFEHRRMMQRR